MSKEKVEQKTNVRTEEQIKADIKKAKEELKEIKSKGSWKHMYRAVREKTLELEKNKEMKQEEKKKQFVEFFNSYMEENKNVQQ